MADIKAINEKLNQNVETVTVNEFVQEKSELSVIVDFLKNKDDTNAIQINPNGRTVTLSSAINIGSWNKNSNTRVQPREVGADYIRDLIKDSALLTKMEYGSDLELIKLPFPTKLEGKPVTLWMRIRLHRNKEEINLSDTLETSTEEYDNSLEELSKYFS